MTRKQLTTIILGLTCALMLLVHMAAAEMQGEITVLEKDGVKIHTYVSPEDSNLDATHIIEGEKSLVLVDAQFLMPYAQEFRAYADSLGKPIERLIVSHAHPDHFFGLAAFADVPSYALAGVQQAIEQAGPGMLERMRPRLGEAAPEKVVVPTEVIEPGTATIDGVQYEFERLIDGEAEEQLVIKLPDLGVLIVQDLAYNKTHLFSAANREGWISILEELQTLEGYDVVLAGHGGPADKSVLTGNIAYLQDVAAVLGSVDNGEDFVARLSEKYPDYRGGLHKLSASILFPKK